MPIIDAWKHNRRNGPQPVTRDLRTSHADWPARGRPDLRHAVPRNLRAASPVGPGEDQLVATAKRNLRMEKNVARISNKNPIGPVSP